MRTQIQNYKFCLYAAEFMFEVRQRIYFLYAELSFDYWNQNDEKLNCANGVLLQTLLVSFTSGDIRNGVTI